MMIDKSEPGFWESVVLDMIVHPHPRSFGWLDAAIIAAILVAVAVFHELPFALARWVLRSAGKAYRKANRMPPSDPAEPPPR